MDEFEWDARKAALNRRERRQYRRKEA